MVLVHFHNSFPSITIALTCMSWVYLWFTIEYCYIYIIYHYLVVLTFSHLQPWINMQINMTCNSITDWLTARYWHPGWVAAHNLQTDRLPARRLATRKLIGSQLEYLELADSQLTGSPFRITPILDFCFQIHFCLTLVKSSRIILLQMNLTAVLIMSSALKLKILRQIVGFILPFICNFLSFSIISYR